MRTVFRNVDASEARQQAGHDNDGYNDDEFFPGAEHAALNEPSLPERNSRSFVDVPERNMYRCPALLLLGGQMAKKSKKQSARGRKQDRGRVAGGQDYEVGYEARKTRRSKSAVKNAVKKVGNTRKRVEKRLRER
jgi:hypothetical protein